MLSRSRCRLRAIRSEWTIEERNVPVLIGRVTSRFLERLSAAGVDNAPGKKKGGRRVETLDREFRVATQ